MTSLEFGRSGEHPSGQSVYIAHHGTHYYEIRGALGQWRVFHSDGEDVFKPPVAFGPTHPSLTDAIVAASRHLQHQPDDG